MREIRIHTDQQLTAGEDVRLEVSASRHLVSALRLQTGDAITLFNGCGGEYAATLASANAKAAVVSVGDYRERDVESPLAVHLGIGISRGDRMDWIVQKATELGVQAITPLYTERTEVKLKGERAEKKIRHWQQVAISACEQSGRNRVPEIKPLTPIDKWMSVKAKLKLVLHHRSEDSLDQLEKPGSIALLVGPEGGLTQDEISHALSQEFHALNLGPRVLRTETAPLAAISIVQSLWGDMGLVKTSR